MHLGNHWTCAVVDFQNRCIIYYDSLGARSRSDRPPFGWIAVAVALKRQRALCTALSLKWVVGHILSLR